MSNNKNNKRVNNFFKGTHNEPNEIVYSKHNDVEGWHKLENIKIDVELGGAGLHSIKDLFSYLINKDVRNDKNIATLKNIVKQQNDKIKYLERKVKDYGLAD